MFNDLSISQMKRKISENRQIPKHDFKWNLICDKSDRIQF